MSRPSRSSCERSRTLHKKSSRAGVDIKRDREIKKGRSRLPKVARTLRNSRGRNGSFQNREGQETKLLRQVTQNF
jgi:hypothetical protein